MKNLKLVTLLLFVCLITSSSIFAQTKTFNDVLSMSLRNAGTITDNNEVKGYFFFYMKDKVNRKMNTYFLSILDQNLNEIGSKEITDSKHILLIEGKYNGQKIMLKFLDTKTKEFSFKSFDKSAKLENSDMKTVTKQEMYSVMAPGAGKTLFSVEGAGFLDYTVRKNKKAGYEIEFFPSDGNSEKWIYETDPEAKSHLSPTFLHANKKVVISSILNRPKASMKGSFYSITSNSMKDGKRLWDTKLEDDTYELALLNTYVDEDKNQVTLFGSYFKKDANMKKAKSLGLFSIILDASNGTIINRNYISWMEDAGEFVEINDKGKIKSIGYVYFHKFIRTADGRIFAIGEQYRKAVNAGAIAGMVAITALAAATGGSASSDVSVMKMVVEDFYIFEFNQDFTLKDIKVFEKGKTNIVLAEGMGILSPTLLAQYIKMTGQFDYYFTQTEDNGEVMHIGYLDYDKSQEKDEKRYFGAITYADGEFTSDKVLLKTKKKTSITVLPAKSGHVIIIEYNRKEKTMDMRLEAINF